MIIFYNPHVDDFLSGPLQFKLLRRRALKKYGFLITEAIQKGEQINICYDHTCSGLIPENIFRHLPNFIRFLFTFFEFRFWMKVNKLTKHINVVKFKDLDAKNHLLLAFSYKSATGLFSERVDLFHRCKAVIFHLSHYFISTKLKSYNISKIKNAFLAGDSDFTANPYFKKHFGWYEKEFLTLPFAIEDRFKVSKEFLERKEKAIATGTFHDLTKEPKGWLYKDFIKATNLSTYHPIRKSIYMSASQLSETIDSKISYYRDYDAKNFSSVSKLFKVSQKSYFSIDIVDLYNDYQFAIIGEEVTGSPAIGALEAMACGCVVFVMPEFYSGYNLVEGRDYVSYDGSIEDLNRKIKGLAIKNAIEISKNGALAVQKSFSKSVMRDTWIARLNNLI